MDWDRIKIVVLESIALASFFIAIFALFSIVELARQAPGV
jgi:hypothetical protein